MIWVLLFTYCKMLIMKTKATNSIEDTVARQQIPAELYKRHYRRPVERPFLKDERSVTNILLGGLSNTHDRLIAAALSNLGLKARALPPTTLSAFELGREYGNNGYCNPTYFTVGNLIGYLKTLEKSGLSKAEIIDKYAFLTAGCNAPCRFGLIEIEYRMALKDAGYQGFRILVFKKEDGLNQEVKGMGMGIEITPTFFLAIVNAINLADVLTGFANNVRPLEVRSGLTEEIKEKAVVKLSEVLKNKRPLKLKPRWQKIFEHLGLEKRSEYFSKTERAIGNLYKLSKNWELDNVKLLRYFKHLKRNALDKSFLKFFKYFELRILKNLHSTNPNLRYFDLYRLNHLILLDQDESQK